MSTHTHIILYFLGLYRPVDLLRALTIAKGGAVTMDVRVSQ